MASMMERVVETVTVVIEGHPNDVEELRWIIEEYARSHTYATATARPGVSSRKDV